MLKKILSGFLISFFSFPVFADSEGQVWAQFASQGKVTENLRLSMEAQARYGLSTGGFTTTILRPAIGWQLSEPFSLWAGYGWTPSWKLTSRDEHRVWTQGVYVWKGEGVTVTKRLRLEDRFIATAANSAWRLRYQVRVVVPVAYENKLSLAISDEVFFHLNDASPLIVSGFDQNRLFLGVNHKLSPELAFEVGYLWNTVNRIDPTPDRNNHAFVISLYHSFDWQKAS